MIVVPQRRIEGGARVNSWRTFWRKMVRRFFHLGFLLRRPMTLGVRAIVLDDRNRVFLVRHGYVPGWHFPGGGVDRGETCEQAMWRELQEEGHIDSAGPAVLHGFFFNPDASPWDHVAAYVVRDFRVGPPRKADWEIQESGFFPLDALPDGTAAGTRRRLAEVLQGAPVAPTW